MPAEVGVPTGLGKTACLDRGAEVVLGGEHRRRLAPSGRSACLHHRDTSAKLRAFPALVNRRKRPRQDVVFPCCAEHNIGVINVFTVRNLFGNPPRLREVIQDLKRRGKIAPEALPDETPLDWLLEDPEVGSLVAAAYRYALHTEPVTAVMSGTIERSELEENVATSGQPPLPEYLRDRLKEIFGVIAEPIGN